MKTSHVVVVLNPRAGRGAGARSRGRLEALLEKSAAEARAQGRDFSFEIQETTHPGLAARTGEKLPGSGSDLAVKALRAGADIVAVAGGDGTVGEVANGLVGSPCPLAILPVGTGNDISRCLGMGTSLESGVKALFFGEPKRVDVGRTPQGVFLNAASFGFDAEVAAEVNRRGGDSVGPAAYLLAVAKSLSRLKRFDLQLTLDGRQIETPALLCAVANSQSYGGGMKIAPRARLDDGLLDVVVVTDPSLFEFLKTLPKVFRGGHEGHPKVKMYRVKSVEVRTNPPTLAQADGDPIGETPCFCEAAPGALVVMHPRS